MKMIRKKAEKKVDELQVEETKKEEVTKKITAKVFDINTGLRVIEDVKVIKIKSKYFTLAILSDYTPSLGEIEGEVSIVTQNDLIKIENVNAFFHHQNNSFSLLIKEQIGESDNDRNT